MKKVGIIMGSKSDLPVMQDAIDILKEFGVDTDEPDLFNTSDQTPTSEDLLGSSDNNNEEDDLEIPAFLRRQKN